MTCLESTHRRIDLAPGATQTFNTRLDASVSGAGTFTSQLWVDSNDPARRRVVVPVTFTVSSQPAAAPTATADAAATDRDVALTVPAPGLMGNDRGQAALTAQKVSDPAHGTVTIASDGSFTYTPAARYVGADAFTYRITDGQGRQSAPATVTITVRDVPHISVNPTTVGTAASTTGTAQTTVQITNNGGGTLRVGLIDTGSGGTPSNPVAVTRISPAVKFIQNSSLICFDGQAYWSYRLGSPDLVRFDPVSGQELARFPHGLPDYSTSVCYGMGLTWTGSRVALVDNGSLSTTTYLVTENAKIRLYDPQTGAQTAITIPVGLGQAARVNGGLAYDGAGGLWSTAFAKNATYRTDIATGITTTYPKLAYSGSILGGLAWFDGSLWAKDCGTIKRFHPQTGALLGSWTWPASGDTIPTVNNLYFGFDSLGGGRFVFVAGTTTTPQLLTVDMGMQGWLGLSPTDLNNPAGTTQSVTLTCTGARAALGANTALIRLLSNDVDARSVDLPVTFTVSGAANLAPVIGVPADAGSGVLVLP
jgi:VCBS repeat-containing protein